MQTGEAHIYIHSDTQINIQLPIHMYSYKSIYTYLCNYTQAHICICKCVYIHTHIHIIHTCMDDTYCLNQLLTTQIQIYTLIQVHRYVQTFLYISNWNTIIANMKVKHQVQSNIIIFHTLHPTLQFQEATYRFIRE